MIPDIRNYTGDLNQYVHNLVAYEYSVRDAEQERRDRRTHTAIMRQIRRNKQVWDGNVTQEAPF